MAKSLILEGILIKDIEIMIKHMDKDFIHGKLEANILEILLKAAYQDMGKEFIQQETCT